MISSANTPGELGDSEFYDAAPLEPHLLYQGEILIDTPLLNMPKPSRWLLLRTRSGKQLDEALEQGRLGGLARVLDSNQTKEEWNREDCEGDFVMARLSKRQVLVLSQTCDVQTKNFIQVAPIFPAVADPQYVEKLKKDEVISAIWVKKHPPELKHESYADLELIQAVHQSYLRRISPIHHFRLSESRVRLMQRSITRYFGRPNSFDAGADIAPRLGTYLCVSCFYMDGRVSPVSVAEGQPFTKCEVCGGRAWVLKGR